MNLRMLLGFTRPYRWTLFACSALMVVETAAALAVPWLGGLFAGRLLSQSGDGTAPVLAALVALFALQALIKFANAYVLSATGERVLADLRTRVYDHLQSLPLAFHQERRKGDVLAFVTYDVAQLANFLTNTLLSLAPLLLTVLGAVVLMFRIEPALAGLVALMVPLFYVLLKVLTRRLRPLARDVQQAEADAVATAEEGLSMLPAIKTFTREELESARHTASVERVRTLRTAQERIHAGLEPLVQFVAAAAIVFVLWMASAKINGGDMSPAELVTFLLYAALLTRPVSSLANVYGQAQIARGNLERLAGILTEKPEPLLAKAELLEKVSGNIEFRDVTFAYPGRDLALRAVSLKISAGETIALTGENGAGKSTLVHLLMRLHEPQAGQILIDGIDVATVGLTSLRSKIGIVPQNVLLFNATIADNIGFGKAGASRPEIEHAAKLAQAHDFITGLPEGYATVIGDQGVRLSGGQRQRLALARAMLKDPPILVLDEATAMFDPAGETSFIAEARASLQGRTVIVITHRPASLALADRVVRLSAGRIAEIMLQDMRKVAARGP